MKLWKILLPILGIAAIAHAQTVTIGQNPKNTITGPSTFIDDVELRFGTGGTTTCEWSTTDANANEMVCAGPEGGSVDVPVFVFGDATCNGLDIALFNGLTNGTVAAMNDACTGGTYFSHDGTNGTIVTTTGVLILNPATTLVNFGGTTTGFPLVRSAATSASSPGFAFVGDQDTGVFRQAADSVGVTSGGVETFRSTNTTQDIVSVNPTGASADVDFQALGTSGTAYLVLDAGTSSVNFGAAGVGITNDGDGAITLLGLGDGSDENLTLNLDDTANTVTVTSSTGVTLVNFSGVDVTSTACSSIESVEYNPTEAGATEDYVNLMLSGLTSSDFSATETDQDMFMVPRDMIARDLRAEVNAAPGVGNDAWVITLRDDAASSTLTCTIDEAATNCSDTTNAPALVAGSKLDILVISSGAGADPNTAATMNIAFCLGQ